MTVSPAQEKRSALGKLAWPENSGWIFSGNIQFREFAAAAIPPRREFRVTGIGIPGETLVASVRQVTAARLPLHPMDRGALRRQRRSNDGRRVLGRKTIVPWWICPMHQVFGKAWATRELAIMRQLIIVNEKIILSHTDYKQRKSYSGRHV